MNKTLNSANNNDWNFWRKLLLWLVNVLNSTNIRRNILSILFCQNFMNIKDLQYRFKSTFQTTFKLLYFRDSGISPIRTFANRTFAIGESPLYFRQYTTWNFANWRMSTVLSPIYSMDSHQLAKAQWTFADTLHGISSIGESIVDFREFEFEFEVN